jgi:drug/metabolite transporter (DMT)-like permease
MGEPGGVSAGRGSWTDTAIPPVFVLLWSSAFVAAVIGVGAAPPLLLTCARFTAAGALLAGLALLTKARWPRGRQLGHVAVSGLLMQAVQFGATYLAVGSGLPVGVVALIQGLNPVLIALLAAPVLRERIRPRQWWGFGLGGVGVLVAVLDQWRIAAGGVVCALVGLLGLSVGTVYQKRYVRDMNVLAGTAVQFGVSAPVMAVATLLLEQPKVTSWPAFGASLAWIVVVNSIGTFVLLNVMLRRGAASRVGSLFFLTPVVTAVLSWAVLGRGLAALELTGLALGGVGVLLAAAPALSRRSRFVSGDAPRAARCASWRPAATGPWASRRRASSAR